MKTNACPDATGVPLRESQLATGAVHGGKRLKGLPPAQSRCCRLRQSGDARRSAQWRLTQIIAGMLISYCLNWL